MTIKKISLFLCLTIISLNTQAGNKIKFYFNHPVDVSTSTTINAVYLNSCTADTLVAYINRAKYSIDIAQYEYAQGSTANIAAAIDTAYNHGIRIRWIYDGSAYNPSFSLLNAGIHKLASPTTSGYGIMHDKFVTIDGNSTDPNDAIVWTGSFDWSTEQFNSDYNNAVIIQDSALAHAYIAEFNMMWGDTGISPNASLSKFGPDKTDLGRHTFTIEGNTVELYFSPSDGTNGHILSAISSANTDMYFGMYTFTESLNATSIVSKYTSGVYVAGIDDSYSNGYSPYTTFTSGLGSNFKVYSGSAIYHNKFLIVDPSDKCSDPLVLTGSHNWTTSADTKNDENTLIIHNDTAANVFYQSFHSDFVSLGGTLSTILSCPTGVLTGVESHENINLYPNPSQGDVTVDYKLPVAEKVSINVFNVLGQKIISLADMEMQLPGSHSYNCTFSYPGIYFAQIVVGDSLYVKKLIVSKQ